MLSPEPNIIFIDDKREEVEKIIEFYLKDGYGVRFFNADFDKDIGDQFPENPYYDVNLIFLDLYYSTNIIDFDKEICADWIESIVPENSFYILVIWSQDTDKSKEVINEIKIRNRTPYFLIEKQKSDYFTNNKWDFEKLYSDVNQKLKEMPEIEELALWKKSIKNATNKIIGQLSYNLDPNGFNKKLKKIILNYGGKKSISENSFLQNREVLFNALDNVLNSNSKSTRPSHQISSENSKNLYTIDEGFESDIDAKLNSWFHFNIYEEPIDKFLIEPGLISSFLDEKMKRCYGILEDENVEAYLKHQIKEIEKANSKTSFLEIALILSRPCDIAQNKHGRNLKLISGLLINNPIRKENNKKEFKSGTPYDSIRKYDHIFWSDTLKDNTLLFDYRYIFSVPEDVFIDCFKNLKIFNREILSDLQVSYSSYSSRLGITQIIL